MNQRPYLTASHGSWTIAAILALCLAGILQADEIDIRQNAEAFIKKSRNSTPGNGDRPVVSSSLSRSLEWLSDQQQRDGGWSFSAGYRYPFSDPGKNRSRVEATGVTVLAFLGAGHTHLEGRYQKSVEKGLRFLGAGMKLSEAGGDLRDQGSSLRSHAIGALVLCESYGTTADPQLRGVAQESVRFLESVQNKDGGWGQKEGATSDLETTAWAMTVLACARLCNLQVDGNVPERLTKYLDGRQRDDGTFWSEEKENGDRLATACGLQCRRLLGYSAEDRKLWRPAIEYLVETKGQKKDCVLDYFSASVIYDFSAGNGEDWETWFRRLQSRLGEKQKTEGPEWGSWHDPADVHAKEGGRLFHTAINSVTLQVEFRNLSTFQPNCTF